MCRLIHRFRKNGVSGAWTRLASTASFSYSFPAKNRLDPPEQSTRSTIAMEASNVSNLPLLLSICVPSLLIVLQSVHQSKRFASLRGDIRDVAEKTDKRLNRIEADRMRSSRHRQVQRMHRLIGQADSTLKNGVRSSCPHTRYVDRVLTGGRAFRRDT